MAAVAEGFKGGAQGSGSLRVEVGFPAATELIKSFETQAETAFWEFFVSLEQILELRKICSFFVG